MSDIIGTIPFIKAQAQFHTASIVQLHETEYATSVEVTDHSIILHRRAGLQPFVFIRPDNINVQYGEKFIELIREDRAGGHRVQLFNRVTFAPVLSARYVDPRRALSSLTKALPSELYSYNKDALGIRVMETMTFLHTGTTAPPAVEHTMRALMAEVPWRALIDYHVVSDAFDTCLRVLLGKEPTPEQTPL